MEPGPLAMMVLSGIDPATLDDGGRLDYAREWERQQRWAAACTQSALAEVMVCDLPDDDEKISETLEYPAPRWSRPHCNGRRVGRWAASISPRAWSTN